MTLRCPNCGIKLDIAELALSERQRAIREAIEVIERDTKKPARTEAIAVMVDYAPSTIKPDLRFMASDEIGVLCRPNGPKSGWSLKKSHLRLVRAA